VLDTEDPQSHACCQFAVDSPNSIALTTPSRPSIENEHGPATASEFLRFALKPPMREAYAAPRLCVAQHGDTVAGKKIQVIAKERRRNCRQFKASGREE
jgi:hypothetical protein